MFMFPEVVIYFQSDKDIGDVYQIHIKTIKDALGLISNDQKALEMARQEIIELRGIVDAMIAAQWEKETYGNHIRRELPWPEDCDKQRDGQICSTGQ